MSHPYYTDQEDATTIELRKLRGQLKIATKCLEKIADETEEYHTRKWAEEALEQIKNLDNKPQTKID